MPRQARVFNGRRGLAPRQRRARLTCLASARVRLAPGALWRRARPLKESSRNAGRFSAPNQTFVVCTPLSRHMRCGGVTHPSLSDFRHGSDCRVGAGQRCDDSAAWLRPSRRRPIGAAAGHVRVFSRRGEETHRRPNHGHGRPGTTGATKQPVGVQAPPSVALAPRPHTSTRTGKRWRI